MKLHLLSPEDLANGADVRTMIKLNAFKLYHRQFGLFSVPQAAMLALIVGLGYQKLGVVFAVTFLTIALFTSMYWVLPRLGQAFYLADVVAEFIDATSAGDRAIACKVTVEREHVDLDLIFLAENGDLSSMEMRADEEGTRYVHREHNQYTIRRVLERSFPGKWTHVEQALAEPMDYDERQAA